MTPRRRLPAVAVVLATVLAGCSPDPAPGTGAGAAAGDVVTTQGPALPTPRTEVAGTVWDGALVVLGGIDRGNQAVALVHRLTDAAGEWERLPDLPIPLHHTTAVVVGGELWVLGGYAQEDGAWRPTAEVWRLAAPDGSWRAGPALPGPRAAHAAVTTSDGVLVLAGGTDGSGGATASTLVLDGDRWRDGPSLSAAAEHLAAAPTVDGAVLVVGGRDGGLGSASTVTTQLRVQDGTVVAGPELHDARSGFGAALVGGRVCVAGGEVATGTVASIECLDGSGWEVVAQDAVPRHGLAVLARGDTLHLVAGGPEPGFTHSDEHRLVTP